MFWKVVPSPFGFIAKLGVFLICQEPTCKQGRYDTAGLALGSQITTGLTYSPGKSRQRFPPGFGSGPKFLRVGERPYKILVKSKSETNCCSVLFSQSLPVPSSPNREGEGAHSGLTVGHLLLKVAFPPSLPLAPGPRKRSWWEEMLCKTQFPSCTWQKDCGKAGAVPAGRDAVLSVLRLPAVGTPTAVKRRLT